MDQLDLIREILDALSPLEHPRGARMPLYLWALRGMPASEDATARELLREADARGLAFLAVWDHEDLPTSLDEALRLGRLQQELGLSIGADAIKPLYSFCDGSPATAHVDEHGEPFFDRSHSAERPIGCPFALDHRYPEIAGRVHTFAKAYREAELPLGFVFSDWEIDGPLEWNNAWDHIRRCRRCRAELGDVQDFGHIQRILRSIRADMQRECYAKPILQRFPEALVGNYAVYAHGGMRYWYDYFEEFNPELPHIWDQREPSRPWAHEYPALYTWYRTFDWYDYAVSDYHWFYNMLKVASNAGKHKPDGHKLITFVHHTLTDPPDGGAESHVVPMSPTAYQELLWHALLRGHDALFSWSPNDVAVHEAILAHQVYAESLAYADLAQEGQPVAYDVPTEPGTVVSALRVGQKLLVRRTDFDESDEPFVLSFGNTRCAIPNAPGVCQIVDLR
jgi:hypothetical protein